MKSVRYAHSLLCGLLGMLTGFALAAAPTRDTPELTRRTLEEKRWELLSWGDEAVPGREGGAPPVLEFDGIKLSGHGGCNRFSGNFSLSGRHLTSTTLATTRKACPEQEMAFEHRYLDVLRSVTVVDVNTTRLILNPVQGRSLVFLARPKPGKRARTRYIYVAAQMVDCQGVVRQKCLQVREDQNRPWRLLYSPIIGFNFQPGIEYRLRVLEEDVTKIPADGPSLRWTLDQVVEQTVVEPK